MGCLLHRAEALADSSLAERELESPVPELVASASGIILELGPGSGTQVLRFDPKKVTKIYGVEPNAGLHDRLRARVKEAGLSDVYTIVPCGVDDAEELKKYDIKGESFDTVLIIQVLCGVSNPKEAVASSYRLLKRGGQMIVYEHGLNHVDSFSRIIQSIYNIIWPHVLIGCELTRDVGRTLVGTCTWSKVDLHQPTGADAATLLPRTLRPNGQINFSDPRAVKLVDSKGSVLAIG
ncbi:MAG: hypothetical protein Q9167_007435 [Letrouitia subvulpina]